METRSWLSDASFYSVSLALVGMDLGQIKAYCSFKGTVWIVISLCFLFFPPLCLSLGLCHCLHWSVCTPSCHCIRQAEEPNSEGVHRIQGTFQQVSHHEVTHGDMQTHLAGTSSCLLLFICICNHEQII